MKRLMCWCIFSLAVSALAETNNPSVVAAQEIPPAVIKAQQARIAAIARASKSAISVFAPGGKGGGSGVVITPDGYALTNFHVAKPAGSAMKCSMPDDRLYDAVIVGIDPVGDVAMIKLLGRDDFPAATMVDSDQVKVGDWCFAIGNPFLLATDFQPTVTYGIVSGVHRYQYPAGTLLEYADCIQTDASINPGNSGGPLFNANGDLIGINGRGSFEKRGRVNVGVGYAISINQIKHFMGYLRSGRILDHATLGATVATDEGGRVIVTNILESSDAYRRGLRYGDEIVSFGNRRISTVNGFKNVLGIFPRGWRVPLTYQRDAKTYETFVRLSGVHSPEQLLAKIQRPAQGAPPKPGGERPGNKKPGGGKPEGKPQPPRRPGPPAQAAPKMPAAVAKYFKARRGYANYYFNTLNRNRVWDRFAAEANCQQLDGKWTLSGKIANRGDVEIILDEQEIRADFPQGQVRVDLTKDFDTQLAPAGSGGLLVSLHLWKKLLTTGPAQFGDVYYLGTAPVLNQEGVYDVLVGTRNVVETRFMFDPQSGKMIGLEMYPDLSLDPCEISFSDYREINGRSLPHQLKVRYGNNEFAVVELTNYAIPAQKKQETKKP